MNKLIIYSPTHRHIWTPTTEAAEPPEESERQTCIKIETLKNCKEKGLQKDKDSQKLQKCNKTLQNRKQIKNIKKKV